MSDVLKSLDDIPLEQVPEAVARLTSRRVAADPTYDAKEKYRQWRDEYEATLHLMQDTGQSIWVINGAYLLAATVLLSAVVDGTLRSLDGPLLLFATLAGFLICSLWFSSFQRNYNFYVLRIEYAKRLEQKLGFWLLRVGAMVGDDEDGGLELDSTDRFKEKVEAFERKQRESGEDRKRFPLELGGMSPRSIQGLTTGLILIFAVFFAALFGFEMHKVL